MIAARNEFNIRRKTILLNLGQINYKILREKKNIKTYFHSMKNYQTSKCSQIRKILMILILSDQEK
jgi:hypothetical protein